MDDALLVRGFQRVGDLFRDWQGLVERNRPRAIRCDERPRPRPSPSRARGCCRCRPSRKSPRCSDDSAMPGRALRAGTGPVDRHRAANDSGRTFSATSRLQLGIARPIHLTHAARADEGDDLVSAESSADAKAHRLKEGRDYTGGMAGNRRSCTAGGLRSVPFPRSISLEAPESFEYGGERGWASELPLSVTMLRLNQKQNIALGDTLRQLGRIRQWTIPCLMRLSFPTAYFWWCRSSFCSIGTARRRERRSKQRP